MGAPKSFAQIAGEQTRAALAMQDTERAGAAAKKTADDEALQLNEREWAQSKLSEAKETVLSASSEGKNTVRINIMRWQRESYPDWAKYRASFLVTLLEKDGLKAKVDCSTMKSSSSDPLFDHDVHDIDVEVSW